jgi:FixJ family two-component response regulator
MSKISSDTYLAVNPERAVVLVLDDDPRVREALSSLLRAASFQVSTFESAAKFLQATPPEAPNCLVLDLQLPDITGLELQRKLAERNGPPIIFISGHGDIPSSVQAIKAGAVEFLPKPFSDQELLSAVNKAISRDQEERRKRSELAELQRSYALLSAREREVLPLVVAGLTNKQCAAKLGIAEITLQVHRGRIMRKMAARSVPELVRMVSKLGNLLISAYLYDYIIGGLT